MLPFCDDDAENEALAVDPVIFGAVVAPPVPKAVQVATHVAKVQVVGTVLVAVDYLQVLGQVLAQQRVVARHLKGPPPEDVVGDEVVPHGTDLKNF